MQFENLHAHYLDEIPEIVVGMDLREKEILGYILHARNSSEYGADELSSIVVEKVSFGVGSQFPAMQVRGGAKGAMGDCYFGDSAPNGRTRWGIVDRAIFSGDTAKINSISNMKDFSRIERTIRLVDVVDRGVKYTVPQTPSGFDHPWKDLAEGAMQILEKKLERALAAALS